MKYCRWVKLKISYVVAIHLRIGTGVDSISSRKRFPLRCPNMQFYIDQLHIITKMFPTTPLHVHLFTDDPNPPQLAKRFENEFKNSNITFSYRKVDNKHDKNVLEDFFAMMKFDILIRSGSYFSYYVWRLGEHEIMICPKTVSHFDEKEGFWVIKETQIIKNNES